MNQITIVPYSSNDDNKVAKILQGIAYVIWVIGGIAALGLMLSGCAESSAMRDSYYYGSGSADMVMGTSLAAGLVTGVVMFVSGLGVYALAEIIRLLQKNATTMYEVRGLENFTAEPGKKEKAPEIPKKQVPLETYPGSSSSGNPGSHIPDNSEMQNVGPKALKVLKKDFSKVVLFEERPDVVAQVVCPVCGTVQASTRNVCHKCSAEFVFKGEGKDFLYERFL